MSNGNPGEHLDGQSGSVLCIRSWRHFFHTDISQTKQFSLGEALDGYFPFLETIFSYLTYDDLKLAALVNRTWKDLVEKTIQKRQTASVAWLNSNRTLHISKHFKYSKPSCSLVFCLPRMSLATYLCLHGQKSNHSCERVNIAEYIAKEAVGADNDYLIVSCPGICPAVINNPDCIDSNKKQLAMITAVSLPVIPGIKTLIFTSSPKDLKKMKLAINDYTENNYSVKALLMFAVSIKVSHLENFLRSALKNQEYSSVAFAGGLVRGARIFAKPSKVKTFSARDLYTVAILEEPNANTNFSASTIVIPTGSKSFFENKIIELKQKSALREHGVAFRICCIAKFGKKDETSVFQKHFPNYSLIGLDVDGELGWDCLQTPRENEDSTGESAVKKKKIDLADFQHEWTTIILLLTWGKKITT